MGGMNATRAYTTGLSLSTILEITPGSHALESASQLRSLSTAMLADHHSRDLWGAEIKENPPTVTYSEVMESEEGVAKMTSLIVGTGLHIFDFKRPLLNLTRFVADETWTRIC